MEPDTLVDATYTVLAVETRTATPLAGARLRELAARHGGIEIAATSGNVSQSRSANKPD